MRFILALLSSLVFVLLSAQTTDTLAVGNAIIHVEKAYHLMQISDFANALSEYESALALDSTNLNAQKGILWAHNSMLQWKATLAEGSVFLRQYPDDGAMHLMMAYAAFSDAQNHKARYHYLQNSRIDGYNPINTSGLAWSARNLGNYVEAGKFTLLHQKLADPKNWQTPREYYSIFSNWQYGILPDEEILLHQRYGFYFKFLEFSVGSEEIHQDKDIVRIDHFVGLEKDTPYLNLKWQYHSLKGGYDNLYPAISQTTQINHIFYLKNAAYIPQMSGAVTKYPILSVYQFGINQTYQHDRWWVGASYHSLYHDFDVAEADVSNYWLTLDAGARLHSYADAGIFAGTGNNSFYVDEAFSVVDHPFASKQQVGAYLSLHYKMLNGNVTYIYANRVDESKSSYVFVTLRLNLASKGTHHEK